MITEATKLTKALPSVIQFFLISILIVGTNTGARAEQRPIVELRTNKGTIVLELRPDRAPETTVNFLAHVQSGKYAGSIFHRVIKDFMIQGGGFTSTLEYIPTDIPKVALEDQTGLSNTRGTVSLARIDSDVNSGGQQFFINVIDNPLLNASSERPGYAVFGRVVRGMNVVDEIARAKVTKRGDHQYVPKKPVVIHAAVWTNRDVILGAPTGPGPEAKLQSSGTCFAVSSKGEIVTAFHVIEGATSIRVELSDGRILPASVVASSSSNDIAILKIEEQTPAYLQLAPTETVGSGDMVFTFGFPATDILGTEVKFSQGAIASMSGLRNEASHIQMDVPIQPGNSGGPLVTFRGVVIGMVVSTASVEQFYASVGALPQGINWAVKSDYIRLLLPGYPAAKPLAERKAAVSAARDAVCRVVGE